MLRPTCRDAARSAADAAPQRELALGGGCAEAPLRRAEPGSSLRASTWLPALADAALGQQTPLTGAPSGANNERPRRAVTRSSRPGTAGKNQAQGRIGRTKAETPADATDSGADQGPEVEAGDGNLKARRGDAAPSGDVAQRSGWRGEVTRPTARGNESETSDRAASPRGASPTRQSPRDVNCSIAGPTDHGCARGKTFEGYTRHGNDRASCAAPRWASSDEHKRKQALAADHPGRTGKGIFGCPSPHRRGWKGPV